jgi:predicted DsbA family dithiol-disulfide isomerase
VGLSLGLLHITYYTCDLHIIATMTYTSTITFTLDTICPWTYLAFIRLRNALEAYRFSHPESSASFTLKLAPYQLYPEMSQEGVDKYDWYKNEKYNGNEQRMGMYMNVMRDLGKEEGVEFDFGAGMVGNTLHAHRVLQHLQGEMGEGDGRAIKALACLYKIYFEETGHPSSDDTLLTACVEAGLSEQEAKGLVQDRDRGLRETKAAIQEQVGNGVDSVPYVVFEGRKR